MYACYRRSKALQNLCFLLYIVMPSLNKISYLILTENDLLYNRASIKESLGEIYSQESPLNFQIWMVGSEVLLIMKYIVS